MPVLSDSQLQNFTIYAARLAESLKAAREAASIMTAILSQENVNQHHPLYKITHKMNAILCENELLTIAGIMREATGP